MFNKIFNKKTSYVSWSKDAKHWVEYGKKAVLVGNAVIGSLQPTDLDSSHYIAQPPRNAGGNRLANNSQPFYLWVDKVLFDIAPGLKRADVFLAADQCLQWLYKQTTDSLLILIHSDGDFWHVDEYLVEAGLLTRFRQYRLPAKDIALVTQQFMTAYDETVARYPASRYQISIAHTPPTQLPAALQEQCTQAAWAGDSMFKKLLARPVNTGLNRLTIREALLPLLIVVASVVGYFFVYEQAKSETHYARQQFHRLVAPVKQHYVDREHVLQRLRIQKQFMRQFASSQTPMDKIEQIAAAVSQTKAVQMQQLAVAENGKYSFTLLLDDPGNAPALAAVNTTLTQLSAALGDQLQIINFARKTQKTRGEPKRYISYQVNNYVQ